MFIADKTTVCSRRKYFITRDMMAPQAHIGRPDGSHRQPFFNNDQWPAKTAILYKVYWILALKKHLNYSEEVIAHCIVGIFDHLSAKTWSVTTQNICEAYCWLNCFTDNTYVHRMQFLENPVLPHCWLTFTNGYILEDGVRQKLVLPESWMPGHNTWRFKSWSFKSL